MPIKPENAKRYPKDWKAIRAKILDRAGHKCERCGVRNYAWRVRSGWSMDFDQTYAMSDGPRDEPVRIVLTIMHLDHTPEHCEESNLQAACQKCHLTYDAKHHAESARQTRRSRKAIGELL